MKTINTPREELICGKLDALFELVKKEKRADMAELVHEIRHDAQRMEAKLIIRKEENTKIKAELTKAKRMLEATVTHNTIIVVED